MDGHASEEIDENASAPGELARRRAPRGRKFAAGEILEKLREWDAAFGTPPTMADWEPARARHRGQAWRIARFEQGDWPSTGMVIRQFGSFSRAVREAGLPHRRGPSRVASGPRSPESVVAAIRDWAMRYGEPPTQADWEPTMARALGHEWRVVRYSSGDWPSLKTVRHHHGSLSAAIRAAALEPRLPGRHGRPASGVRGENRVALAHAQALRPGPSGPAPLGAAVREVSQASRRRDPEALHAALVELAACALRWANALGASERELELVEDGALSRRAR